MLLPLVRPHLARRSRTARGILFRSSEVPFKRWLLRIRTRLFSLSRRRPDHFGLGSPTKIFPRKYTWRITPPCLQLPGKTFEFVRVRERSAGRLVVERQRKWIPVTSQGEPRQAAIAEEIYATAIERLAESLPEGSARARHYLSAHGFGIRNRGARGQSAYRQRAGFNKAGAKTPKGAEFGNKVLSKPEINGPWDQPSRLPATLEITVVPSQQGDDEDAVASVVAGLRNGYSHTVDGTFLPSPLSFKSKILDYMDRFGIGADVDDQEADLNDKHADQSEDADAVEHPVADAVGYGEIRRWFEGSSDTVEDIPDFDDDEFRNDARTNSDIRPGSGRSKPAADLPRQQPDEKIAFVEADMRTPMATPQTKSPHTDLGHGASSDDATVIDTMVATLRSPAAPLPSFVTEEFLANAMHVVNSDARRMHEDREWIRTVTGFPWPQERPSKEDVPRLYLDALRYPAFAIVFQHQFFPDDNGRGFPKNQIHMKMRELRHRLRVTKPLPKHEPDLHVIWALHAADNGGDKEMLLADVLGLPGQAAWRTKCAKASEGLDRLEARDDEWGELGRYLRAVVGPFRSFGDQQTIGEVMEEIVIPHVMRQASTAQAMSILDSDAKTESPRDPCEENAFLLAENTLLAVEEAWRSHCDQIQTLAVKISAAGPTAGDISEIQANLLVLVKLKERAGQLVPAKVSTAEFKKALQVIATKAAEALSSLIGDALRAPEIISRTLRFAQ